MKTMLKKISHESEHFLPFSTLRYDEHNWKVIEASATYVHHDDVTKNSAQLIGQHSDILPTLQVQEKVMSKKTKLNERTEDDQTRLMEVIKGLSNRR